MSTSLKISLEIKSPETIQERAALIDTITIIATLLANRWDSLYATLSPEEIEKLTVNFSSTFGPNGKHLESRIKSFSHKFANRTVRITPTKS